MEFHEPTRKTRAIMFSDIQGYSKMMGKDESLALRLLDEHNALCKPLIAQGGGTILKFIGDAILSSFESASDAVHCGLEIQRALAQRNSERPECDHIVVRIGIHIGDVVFKDYDVFGDGVNIAARIEPLAEPGGVAISQTVYDMIKARPEIQTVSLGAKELKNIKDAINIYKVLVQAQEVSWASSNRSWLLMGAGVVVLLAAGLIFARFARTSLVSPPVGTQAAPAGVPPIVLSQSQAPAAGAPDMSSERMKVRDDAWGRLLAQLGSHQVPASVKSDMAEQFYREYHLSPGIHPGNAGALAQYLPPGPDRDDVVALARSPKGRESVVRLKVKMEAAKKLAVGMKFRDDQQKKDFFYNNPLAATGYFLDAKEGEPARDLSGNLIFKYKPKPGQENTVPMSPDVFKEGPAGDAAVDKAATDLAKDYLRATGR
jgi:class 3 adenylate cyclase